MQDSIYRFSLDIHSTQSQVSIPVPQYNTARSIQATLTEGGKPYTLSAECRAVLTATKADGTKLYNDCLIMNGSVIRYDFTEQTTTAVGVTECAIKVYGANSKLLTSPRFTLVVYEDPTGDVTPSADELDVIDQILSNDVTQNAAIDEIRNTLYELNSRVAQLNEITDVDEWNAKLENAVSTGVGDHNESASSHNDLRLSINELSETKVNVADIVNDLGTSASDKPLSAAQGVVLKGLIPTGTEEFTFTFEDGHTETKAVYVK